MKWFKHDADMHQNRKIRKLIRTHGATGYAFWCVLLEKIYFAECDFQVSADELWFEDIAEDLKLGDYRTPIRILDTLSELGLISSQLWQDHVIAIPAVTERLRSMPKERHGMRRRSTVYRKHREFVFARDGYECVYCGAKDKLTLDHVIPDSRGGSHTPENLATCCSTCNSSKHARTPQEWLGGKE
jgi:5-methylcytosine-specific restriction endonuclease McrA